MTTTIIISLCTLLLIAYLFDITAGHTRIPAVLLLLALGWLLQQAVHYFKVPMPQLSPALPVLGTVGLILIVLEGSLGLEVTRQRFPLIRKAALLATLPLLLLAAGLGAVLVYAEGAGWRLALMNALPLCIISSAIAIPTAQALPKEQREMVVYESSLSDILGVLFFNFVVLNSSVGLLSIGEFLLQLLLIAGVSALSIGGLAFLLGKIDHHVKYVPIILLVILIYAVSKVYHLPGLVFIMLLGVALGNATRLQHLPVLRSLHPEILMPEVHKLRELTVEGAFLVRSLFFLLFGYVINTTELLNPRTALWALGITATIVVLRALHLWVLRLPLLPLLFIAPRGLITILLFMSVAAADHLPLVNNSLVIQVVVLSALLMMLGTLLKPRSSH